MRYTNERDICQAALHIAAGASNLRGVTNTMTDMVTWLHAQWSEESGYLGNLYPDCHPAVRLCMSQLGVITGASPTGDVEGFTEAYDYCKVVVSRATSATRRQ